MLTLFKHHNTALSYQQPLLEKQELAELRLAAELLDSSLLPPHSLDSRQAGWLPAQPLGSGMDYAESRVYQAGDEPRHINWRLSARSQDTFVKTFHMESRPSLCILLDRRRTMVFGTQCRLKITQALRVAALLAYACEMKHIALHVLIIEEQESEVIWLENQSVDSFLAVANKPCTSVKLTLQSSTQPQYPPSFTTALQHLQQHSQQANSILSKGSLIYLISDFYDLKESHQSDLVQFQDNNFVQAIHIMDSAELRLPHSGRVHLQDMHHDQRYSLKTHDKKEQNKFSKFANQHAEKIRKRITKTGVSYTRLFTHEKTIQQKLPLPLGHS